MIQKGDIGAKGSKGEGKVSSRIQRRPLNLEYTPDWWILKTDTGKASATEGAVAFKSLRV